MTGRRFLAVLDALQQVAEVGVQHAQHAQLLNQANRLFQEAVKGRDDRATFLLELEMYSNALSTESRQHLLVTVHRMLHDQLAFGDACLNILAEPERRR